MRLKRLVPGESGGGKTSSCCALLFLLPAFSLPWSVPEGTRVTPSKAAPPGTCTTAWKEHGGMSQAEKPSPVYACLPVAEQGAQSMGVDGTGAVRVQEDSSSSPQGSTQGCCLSEGCRGRHGVLYLLYSILSYRSCVLQHPEKDLVAPQGVVEPWLRTTGLESKIQGPSA